MLSLFDLITILLALTATFAWMNHRFIHMPSSIGILVMGLLASLLLVAIELSVPSLSLYENLIGILRRIDFRATVLDGMLGFLLFAGALHVDLEVLRSRAWAVGVMASVGVLVSTAVVGVGLWWIAGILGLGLGLPWALVFGALISPTDPVAVLSILKVVDVPKTLEIDMTGESLFNDGIGVVVFTALLAIASGGEGVGALHIGEIFILEAGGGALLGLVAGYVAFRAMRAIDDFSVEVLISLALVTGAYTLASRLHVSGPIAMVTAGLLIGNHGQRYAMSDVTQRYMFGFWKLVDEILNSVLFLLIGLEVLVLRFDRSFTGLLLAAVPLSLLARWLAVGIPVLALASRQHFVRGTVQVLTWGGLRGGISIALALSLPETPEKAILLACTYAVVVFTITVQGLSLRALVDRVVAR